MNTAPGILVASDVVADAELVRSMLQAEFDHVVTSTDPERAIRDFETYRPALLILAFNNLEKAERYYLGLYRLSKQAMMLAHRTLILCGKDDLRQVYELCRKEYFDDYILFWPMTYDAPRLLMATHHALRQWAAAQAAPGAGAFDAQDLAEPESPQGQRPPASPLWRQAEQMAGVVSSEAGYPEWSEFRKRHGHKRKLMRPNADEIERRFQAMRVAGQPPRLRPLILVVDDDQFQIQLLGQMLAEKNLDLVYAASGAEALVSLQELPPDLVLMDVNLPDIDGIETTRRMKSFEQLADIPVIMITGQSEKAVVVESLKAGASDFVVKPIEQAILLAKVSSLLNGDSGQVPIRH